MKLALVVVLSGCMAFTPQRNKRAAFVNLGIMNAGIATFATGAGLMSYGKPGRETIDAGVAIVGVSMVGMLVNLITAAVVGIPHE